MKTMIKKIKEYFTKKKQAKLQKDKLLKTQKYYHLIRTGATFIKFVYDDLEKMKKLKMNRPQRRRWEKLIAEKGKFSSEMIEFYSKKIDEILAEVERRLNPPKSNAVKTNEKKV